MQHTFPKYRYITLDHIRQASAANENPEHFLQSAGTPIVLDEVQYAPDLFRYLKILADQNRRKYGQWLLTGSQKFELMTNVSESLAGRLSLLHLETLSAKELRGSTSKNINDYVWKGGYPELWANPKLDAIDFFESYVRTYVERDLTTIMNVSNLHDFQRFLKITASRVGQLANYKDIAKDVGVSDVTIRKWLHALELSGLVYLLPPYFNNLGKRLVKTPKIYFSDHGLLCFLLNIMGLDGWQNHILRGNVWENVVFGELVKTLQLQPGTQLFFYRDHAGVEADFLIESNAGFTLIEAKASEAPDERKLNFRKIAPLFTKSKVRCILAANIPDTDRVELKDYTLVNPLYSDMVL